jgi:hypothetical protein
MKFSFKIFFFDKRDKAGPREHFRRSCEKKLVKREEKTIIDIFSDCEHTHTCLCCQTDYMLILSA